MIYRRYWKFFGLFLLLTVLVTGLAASYIGEKVRTTLLNQIKTEMQRDLTHTKNLIQKTFLRSPLQVSLLDQAAKELGTGLGKRVSIISADGHLLGDSAREPRTIDRTDDYSHRPEIIMAREKGYGQVIRFSPFMNTQALFAAAPVFRERLPVGFVRLAWPLNELEETVYDFRRRLILMGGLIGSLSLLFGIFLLWWMGRPLKEISGMAEQMAGGNLKQPLHLLPRSEFTPLARSLEKMSKDLRLKLDLLDGETSRLRAILLAMQEGVLVTNEKGLITLVNPFLRQVLGGAVTLENRTIQEVFMNTEFQEAVDQALKGEKFQRLEISLGWDVIRYFEVQVVPLISAHLTQGAVVLFHDITELRRLLKVRQDFVANASHELRTPLTAISGALETLESVCPAEGDTRRFLGILQKNVRRMVYLVSDLLDLSQLEDQERAERFVDEVNVAEVLKTALSGIAPQAQEKNISLSLDLTGLSSEDCSLFWERERIYQAIFNLLDNAIKYTPPGGKVVLSAREGEKEISVSVTDTGLGIPREHLPRIFERFYRVDRDRSRELGGTGLGLSIVKHIVEAHKGKVEARSELGRGSTFTITFPKK
ncbi:MAG: PAS domain-containing protein [Deltaproteobacteria bacterium]|nr:PAS domain-containing protein [Deltaproteobacteria bacterium]